MTAKRIIDKNGFGEDCVGVARRILNIVGEAQQDKGGYCGHAVGVPGYFIGPDRILEIPEELCHAEYVGTHWDILGWDEEDGEEYEENGIIPAGWYSARKWPGRGSNKSFWAYTTLGRPTKRSVGRAEAWADKVLKDYPNEAKTEVMFDLWNGDSITYTLEQVSAGYLENYL